MQELTTELCNSAEQLVIFNKQPLPEGAQPSEKLDAPNDRQRCHALKIKSHRCTKVADQLLKVQAKGKNFMYFFCTECGDAITPKVRDSDFFSKVYDPSDTYEAIFDNSAKSSTIAMATAFTTSSSTSRSVYPDKQQTGAERSDSVDIALREMDKGADGPSHES